MARSRTNSVRVAGTWVHPADGDDYPEALTMIVQEVSGGPGVTAWNTKTVYSATSAFPNRVSEWSYVHPSGAEYMLFSAKRQDGTWSEVSVMAREKWVVENGSTDGARALMHAFFTEAGYVRQETGR